MDFSKARVTKVEALSSSDAKWVKIQKIQYQDVEDKPRDWEFASRTTRVPGSTCDGVAILAVLNDESPEGPRILLQKQFRPPVGKVCIEIPAGLLDADESIQTCAERELLEETGYIGTALHHSPLMFNDPGFCNTNVILVHVAVDLEDPRNQTPKTQLEDGEFIETFTLPLKTLDKELARLVDEGYALDVRLECVATGIALACQYL
ncbi:hypothetical protein NADFUDRAFT_47505 [Nadsonia fulvescens var. elongata DSM 6958]|uniref:Nudix hydrolase domain-containing protein n=1 Tax=Nadsonia fulvescens var. elongata DSM 6958 TaxID=857566 RepID=A0A1E3PH42_9ASCO|nr:hypothetical protein NADFUDRAFT_47505 [Nadsonia fulvescens var. elongata DSM 6958]